jgi:hypothetical protein
MIGITVGNVFGNKSPNRRNHHYRNHIAREFSPYRSATFRGNEFVTPVKIQYQPHRRYTPEAIQKQTTGVVKLLVRFDADGTTKIVERLSTLPNGLTEEAERIAERTEFTPAKVNGEPVSETKEMNYIFSLSESEKIIP